MIILAGSEALDFNNLFKDLTKFAMMHEAKILDVGERIANVANIDKNIEKILCLWRRGGTSSLADCDGENVLKLLANDASMRTGISKVKIAH